MDMGKIKKAKMMLEQAMSALDACMEGEDGEGEDMVDASPEGNDGGDDMAAKSLKMKMAKYRE